MSRTRLVILGGGKMGEALAKGLLCAGWRNLTVVEPRAQRRAELAEAHPGLDLAGSAVAGDGAVIAVKPADVESACRSLAELRVTRCLSIAAGVTLASLQGWLGPDVAALRAMPNTAALVGAAATALSAGERASEDDVAWASVILGALGTVVTLPERSLDAVTGLSGSGPAYLFLVAEALIDGGVSAGLPYEVSHSLVVQTMLGAGRLLAESGEAPADLRAAVTSPGGTTAAGLRVLEGAATRAAFIEAVAAATARSVELGRTAEA